MLARPAFSALAWKKLAPLRSAARPSFSGPPTSITLTRPAPAADTRSLAAPTVGTPGSNGAGLINQGYVETSNVNVVEELVAMIQTQRAYEINSKAIETSDQMLGRLSQL